LSIESHPILVNYQEDDSDEGGSHFEFFSTCMALEVVVHQLEISQESLSKVREVLNPQPETNLEKKAKF
jgi:hypothetical protein